MAKRMIIDARDIVRSSEMTVSVSVINLRSVRFRLMIALQLCKLASWIGGYGLKIDESVGVIVKNVAITKDVADEK